MLAASGARLVLGFRRRMGLLLRSVAYNSSVASERRAASGGERERGVREDKDREKRDMTFGPIVFLIKELLTGQPRRTITACKVAQLGTSSHIDS